MSVPFLRLTLTSFSFRKNINFRAEKGKYNNLYPKIKNNINKRGIFTVEYDSFL